MQRQTFISQPHKDYFVPLKVGDRVIPNMREAQGSTEVWLHYANLHGVIGSIDGKDVTVWWDGEATSTIWPIEWLMYE